MTEVPQTYPSDAYVTSRDSRSAVRWVMASDFKAFVGEHEFPPIEEWIHSHQTEVVKSGEHRVVYRLQLESGEYFLKHFRVPNWRTFGQNLIRPSRAKLEWNAARFVQETGIPTIECVAMGERSVAGSVLDNYLVTKAIPDVIPLDEVLREVLPEFGPPIQSRLRQLIARQTGEILGQLHRNCLYHPDLHPGNILVASADLDDFRSRNDAIRMWLIDLHSMQRRLKHSAEMACRDLALWHNFFARSCTPADRSRFFRAYTTAFPEHQFTTTELNRCCENELRHADRHGDRKWQRANSRQVIGDRWGLYCRGVARLGNNWLKSFRNQPTTIAALSFDVSAPELISWPMTPSELRPKLSAAHAWQMGHALLRRSLPTIEPLAVLEPRSRNRKSHLLLAPHASFRPLPDVLNSTNQLDAIDQLGLVIGRELDRLHECGFHYAEWDGSNILFDEQAIGMAWSHLHRLRQRRRPLSVKQRVARLREILAEFADRPRFQEHVIRSYSRRWCTMERERFRHELTVSNSRSEVSVECPPSSLRAA